MVKVVSLFSGIGGFEKGMLQANPDTEIVFASENDKYARQIYTKQFGGEHLHGDITKINEADVPNHDILCGGFPCQDVSIAGKRTGLCGARSGLFFEIIRILREKQPNLVFLENVAGLLSCNRGWDFAKVLIELEKVGYDCEWQVCNSKNHGVPQNRERVFIIGHLARPERSRSKIFPIRESGKLLNTKEPTVSCLDANYYKGVAQQARTVVLCDSGQGRKGQIRIEHIAPLRANTGAAHNNIVIHSTSPRSSTSGKGGTEHLSRADGTTYCLDAANNLAVEMYGKVRRLTPDECEKLQGFPPGWTSEGIDTHGNVVKISDTQRYKCIGNAVTTNVVEFISKRIFNMFQSKIMDKTVGNKG